MAILHWKPYYTHRCQLNIVVDKLRVIMMQLTHMQFDCWLLNASREDHASRYIIKDGRKIDDKRLRLTVDCTDR